EAGFADLPLPAPVQASLRACGFHVPSPIQAKALPIALFGNDLIAQAKSGMGKTLVFATVAIDLVHRSSTSWAVMLAPTREILGRRHGRRMHWRAAHRHGRSEPPAQDDAACCGHARSSQVARPAQEPPCRPSPSPRAR
uniref:RNA helicase n=1 Tax=Hucho hucho TaxID=62062 RepID=A0A4W5LZY8_9TELE